MQAAPPPTLSVTKIETPRPAASGFMAVNSGGFSAVNAPSGFVAVNHAQPTLSKRDSEKRDGEKRDLDKRDGEQRNGEKRDGELSTAILTTNGHAPTSAARSVSSSKTSHESSAPTINGDIGSNPLKRTMSHDSMNFESGSDGVNGDGDGANGRRSKRLKKGMLFTSRLTITPCFAFLFSILDSRSIDSFNPFV
jgi:hypothetical protein